MPFDNYFTCKQSNSSNNSTNTFSINLKNQVGMFGVALWPIVQFACSNTSTTISDTNNNTETKFTQQFVFGAVSGTVCYITVNENGTSQMYANTFSQYSDYRLKTNVITLDETYTVDNIRVVSYNLINSSENITPQKKFGVIAHELQEIYPELVDGKKDDTLYQGVDYISLIPILINEIQNLKKTNIKLQTDLDKLTQLVNIKLTNQV